MARKIKVDNSVLKRLQRENKKRKQDERPKLQFFLIVTEGIRTEPNYFEAIRRTLPRHAMQHITVEGAGDNTLRIVQKARQLRDDAIRYYDRVWAVFDRDSFPAEHFNEAIRFAESNGMGAAWSNEAFELWYLLHFQFVQHGMSREQYAPFLERELSTRMGQGFSYAKNRPDLFDLLQRFGNESQAIIWAEHLLSNYSGRSDFANQNPCTLVFQLIRELNGLRKLLNP